jgi:hypothetical protein
VTVILVELDGFERLVSRLGSDAADRDEVSRPGGWLTIDADRTAVPAADARNGLLAMLVLVDHVLELGGHAGLGGGSEGQRGLRSIAAGLGMP